jgi:peptidyl-prolyl cis-trans isomerase C
MSSHLTRLLRLVPRALMVAVGFAAVQAAFAAEAPKPALQLASEDPIVATVNGQAIHKSDVMRIKSGLGQQAAQIPLEQIYPQIVRKLVDVQLLADAARTDKLQDQPDVKADLRWSDDNVLANQYVRKFATKAVSDAELKAAYTKFAAAHTGEEEIHARHILVANEADAKAIIADLDKGGDFAKIANEKSTDKSGDGGDLGWFTKEKMVPEFADAAFKLKKGEYTKTPVKSQFGWHVIEVLDRRPAKPPTFDEVKDQLAQQLETQAVTTKVKDLRAAAKVQEFNLDGSPLPAENAPAAAPAPAAAKP